MIRLVSDIHLEFQGYEVPHLPTDSMDTLVCAGDIGVGLQGAEWVCSMAPRFRAIVYIAGNHEFYNSNYTIIREMLSNYNWPSNVHYLHGSSVRVDDTVFIGATLWTDNNRNDPLFAMRVRSKLNDYHCICYGSGKLKPEISSKLHARDREEIVTALSKVNDEDKVVVVSHHLPSYQCIHPDFGRSDLNYAYASDLDDIIYYYKPSLWLFGHTHKTVSLNIGSTIMRSNPRGYYMDSRGENTEFDPYLRLSLEGENAM